MYLLFIAIFTKATLQLCIGETCCYHINMKLQVLTSQTRKNIEIFAFLYTNDKTGKVLRRLQYCDILIFGGIKAWWENHQQVFLEVTCSSTVTLTDPLFYGTSFNSRIIVCTNSVPTLPRLLMPRSPPRPSSMSRQQRSSRSWSDSLGNCIFYCTVSSTADTTGRRTSIQLRCSS